MKLIQENPYRIAGLLVGATAKEQDRQIRRLKQYIEAEQEPQDDFSFPALGKLSRTLERVEEAASKLNLDSDKINAALFWFWNGNPITDEAAFDALKDGDIETAYQIWDKLITRTDEDGQRIWKPVTEKNYSAYHNCSVINIIRANGNLHNAIVSNLYFLESDLVQKFVLSVADETHKTDKKELQLLYLNQLHSDIEVNKRISLPKFHEILNKHEFVAKQDFMKGFVQKPIEQIEQKIETAKNKRKSNKANALNAGQELYSSTINDLFQLKSILGTNDIKYASIADKVANEILQCSIDYFNDSREIDSSSDYVEVVMKLTKQAETLAIGNLTKDRIKDSIKTIIELKDRDLLQVVELLKSVKKIYENSYREILTRAKRELGIMDSEDIFEMIYDEEGNMKSADRIIKEMNLNTVKFHNPFETRTINYDAVKQMALQSVNWEKVNDLLNSFLSERKISLIKNSEDFNSKKDFWELLHWAEENSLKSSVITRLIEKYKSIPPKLCFEILSAEIVNIDSNSNSIEKPFFIEDIRYVGIKLKVNSNGNQKVTIYKKYINPEGIYNHSSKSSPEGYTTSENIIITPLTQIIDLGGWGNKNKCIYMVGEHKIVVYVEHYKVFTKTFQVDWSPNKKSELQRNLALLKNKLKEVENFQWFRSSETKQREVKELQEKIEEAESILMNN